MIIAIAIGHVSIPTRKECAASSMRKIQKCMHDKRIGRCPHGCWQSKELNQALRDGIASYNKAVTLSCEILLGKFCEDLGIHLDLTTPSNRQAVDNFVERIKRS